VRRGISIRRLLLGVVGVLAVVVVLLNWTYGRLPAEPRPTGSFVQIGKLRIHYIEHPRTVTPVVLMHGLPGTAEDWEDVTPLLKPIYGRRLAAELPDSRLVMVYGGHMQPYDHPATIAAAVASLEEG
jgi:pimeloyl-ACP methyl ester carboxylesterase